MTQLVEHSRHERMHRTLKQETSKPAAYNLLQQQGKFDDFMEVYNQQHPHQGIANKYPAELYTASAKIYNGLPEVGYFYKTSCRLEPIDNPFNINLYTMSQ